MGTVETPPPGMTDVDRHGPGTGSAGGGLQPECGTSSEKRRAPETPHRRAP